jgi:3-oxoacyl-[acyl-carrier-protein] synthase-3
MGTIIEASAAATADALQRSLNPGSLQLADAAVRSCLHTAERTAEELDLLINTGVYHDKILSEPAFASLIQEDIGANLTQATNARHGTFSFDLYNGACGLLTAIHLVDGMLTSGTINLAMVVASDMDPEPGLSEGFTFPGVGGAILLRRDDSRAGFTAFQFDTYPEHADLFHGYVDWHEPPEPDDAHHGRNILTVEIADTYATHAIDCAETTARALADTHHLHLHHIDQLIATASVPGFATALAERLHIPAHHTAQFPDHLTHTHTAAPALALQTTHLTPGSTTLFITAGAGITTAAALYHA